MIARMFKSLLAKDTEKGGASVEFVLIFPIFIVIFMSTFEAAFLLTRQMMLDRALDITVRDLRLGGGALTHDGVRDAICNEALILPDCSETLVLEMTAVSTATYALPAADAPCVDKVNDITPVTTFEPGAGNELMLVRACYTVDAIFPGSGLGLMLTDDGDGDLRMSARSLFVNEPA